MPPLAERSGYCCITLQSDPDGTPANVDVGKCSEEVFRSPTEASISRWLYAPYGAAIYPRGGSQRHEQMMKFFLTDIFDRCLPSGDGAMCDAEGGFDYGANFDALCRTPKVS